MIAIRVSMILLLSFTITTVMCQTFHYSHGWTNGKRSTLEELVNSPIKNADQLDNVLVNCELQKLRLLLQGNANSQLLQQPCEYYDFLTRKFHETLTNGYLRQPTIANNNY